MTPDARLLELYETELRQLRAAGADFARRYPKLAARLELSGQGSADPQIERLLESFAFLAARLQRRLEDDLAVAPAALLQTLAPVLARPAPALAIAQMTTGAAVPPPPGGQRVPRGTRLFARGTGGALCRWRTAYDVTLLPLTLSAATLESPAARDLFDRREVEAVVRLTISGLGTALQTQPFDRLRIHLSGPRKHTCQLWELIAAGAVSAVAVPAEATGAEQVAPLTVSTVGFGAEDAVLPDEAAAHPAFRLLREYFVLPEKFLFLDIAGLGARPRSDAVDILIGLGSRPPAWLDLRAVVPRLNCTPVVNLFEQICEPIVLDHRDHAWRVVPELGAEEFHEVHSIRRVEVTAPGDPAPRPVDNYFNRRSDDAAEIYWVARQDMASGGRPGTDTWLSFVEPDLRPVRPARETATAHAWCTNRTLAQQLGAGARLQADIDIPAQITLIDRPTPQVPAIHDAATLWQLVSQLSFNHLSLSDPGAGRRNVETLKEILRLHCPPHRPDALREIRGIRDLACKTVVRRHGAEVWRGFVEGVEIRLTLDEGNFAETGAWLFGAVLRHFFALYVSVNSFAELVLISPEREGVWQRWPPMIGGQELI